MQRTRYLLITALVALALGVAGLLFLLLQQGSIHDRVLMEYRASQMLSALINDVTYSNTETPELELPPEVPGFGIYAGDGSVILAIGNAPSEGLSAEILSAQGLSGQAPEAPGGATVRGAATAQGGSEWSELEGDRLRLYRPGRSRGSWGRSGYGRGGSPGPAVPDTVDERDAIAAVVSGRIIWVIDVNVSSILAERRLRTTVIVSVAVLILALSGLVLHLVNQVRSADARVRRTESLAQLGAAARTIAHEIKNPLAAIRLQTTLLRRLGYAGAVRDGATGAVGPAGAAESALAIIDDEVERLGSLAEGVRSFLGDPRGTPEDIPVCSVLRGVVDRLGFPVSLHCPKDPSVDYARIDRLRFESVIANLCANADHANGVVQYQGVDRALDDTGGTEGIRGTGSQDPGAIEIRVVSEESVVMMSVLDRGPGIPTELRDRVFDPFFSTFDGGSGVGLAVSRAFVHAAGGSLSIEDRAGGGAIMTVTLPRSVGNNAQEQP